VSVSACLHLLIPFFASRSDATGAVYLYTYIASYSHLRFREQSLTLFAFGSNLSLSLWIQGFREKSQLVRKRTFRESIFFYVVFDLYSLSQCSRLAQYDSCFKRSFLVSESSDGICILGLDSWFLFYSDLGCHWWFHLLSLSIKV
jgi:hypothetical protein